MNTIKHILAISALAMGIAMPVSSFAQATMDRGKMDMNRSPFDGRQEATMSVIHGRPVRSLATNRQPAVSG